MSPVSLPPVFSQCAEVGLAADGENVPELPEMVKIHHHVAPEEEPCYKAAVPVAYRDLLAG